jgi:hypothetical protein
MQMNDLTPLQLRQKGLAALVQALGAVGMVRFMQQFEAGSGDYTRDSEALLRSPLALPLAKRGEAQASADRTQLLANVTLEDAIAQIKQIRANHS